MYSIKKFSYRSIHPNPIGLLYEKCKDMGAERPQTRCLASNVGGEHVVQISALSMIQSGASTKKQEAKAIAAVKILLALGHLVLPEGNELDDLENVPFGESISDTFPDTFPEFNSTTAPQFNTDNPILSVNWILWNAGKDLAEVLHEPLPIHLADKTSLWMATCMTTNDKFETSAVGSTKREAEVAAVEAMHKSLLLDPDIRERLKAFEASMERKAFVPTKPSKDYPSNWATMRHPKFLPGSQVFKAATDGNTEETDTEISHGPKYPATLLVRLAETEGFTFEFVEWPRSRFLQLKNILMDSSQNENHKTEVSENDDVRLMLSISFNDLEKQPMILAGLGRTLESAKENAVRNALRYFDTMERALLAENNQAFA